MKYLLVSPFTNASGSAIRFWNIAHSLRQQGHEVVFADRKARGVRQLHSRDDIRYYGFTDTGVLPLDIFLSLFFYTLVFIRHLDCTVYYAFKPAPNNCLVAFFARIAGKKIILDIDDLDYGYLSNRLLRRFVRWYFDFFPRFFNLVTYHTPELGAYLQKHLKIPDKKRYYLAQGASPEFLEKQPVLVPPESPKSIVYVATLGITSDFGDLLSGLEKLCLRHPDLLVHIVGDGCRKAEFEKRVELAGVNRTITFTGLLDHHTLPDFIARHRLGINYMRPTEVNRCRAILKIREYLACGLEVVCNNVGDVELFRDHIHIVNDLSSMWTKTEELLAQPPRFNSEGRKFIENNFSWNSIVSAFQQRVEAL
jgi:glycosyltransferase involved in cell wall biosynthesis